MLYMKDWEVCAPPGFSLGFEGDNGATVLEVSTDLTEEWDLKVDVEKDGEKNIIQLTRTGMVYSALLTASMLADDGTYASRCVVLWATMFGTATFFTPRCSAA